MITKEDYLKALDIVEQYHIELNISIKKEKNLKSTTVLDFLNDLKSNKKNSNLSNRLISVLQRILDENIYEYIEEIENPRYNHKVRNFGIKTYLELKELIKKDS